MYAYLPVLGFNYFVKRHPFYKIQFDQLIIYTLLGLFCAWNVANVDTKQRGLAQIKLKIREKPRFMIRKLKHHLSNVSFTRS